MVKNRKNGWIITARRDPNTGKLRAIKILYRNGREVKHNWFDILPGQFQASERQEELEEYKEELENLGFSLESEHQDALDNYRREAREEYLISLVEDPETEDIEDWE